MSKRKQQSLIKSFLCAGNGIAESILTQRNLRIDLAAALLAIIAGFATQLRMLEWAIILTLIAVVLAAELINTAIEALADAVTLEHNEQIRIAKNAAAGAVLTLAIAAALIGLIIFIRATLRLVGLL